MQCCIFYQKECARRRSFFGGCMVMPLYRPSCSITYGKKKKYVSPGFFRGKRQAQASADWAGIFFCAV
jgi:hypothetical protein